MSSALPSTVTPTPAVIPSPCINVCRMDPLSQLCSGCFRSLEEIAGWAAAGNAERVAILARVTSRRLASDQNEVPHG